MEIIPYAGIYFVASLFFFLLIDVSCWLTTRKSWDETSSFLLIDHDIMGEAGDQHILKLLGHAVHVVHVVAKHGPTRSDYSIWDLDNK